jgi:hypothetical protein
MGVDHLPCREERLVVLSQKSAPVLRGRAEATWQWRCLGLGYGRRRVGLRAILVCPACHVASSSEPVVSAMSVCSEAQAELMHRLWLRLERQHLGHLPRVWKDHSGKAQGSGFPTCRLLLLVIREDEHKGRAV